MDAAACCQTKLDGYSRSEYNGCSGCGRDEGFFQKSIVTVPPRVLVLNVAGWSQNETGDWKRMFSNFEDIHLVTLRGRSYVLRCLSLHAGLTPYSGHYIAVVNHGPTQGWFVYNDANRQSVLQETVQCHFLHRQQTFVSNFLIYESL